MADSDQVGHIGGKPGERRIAGAFGLHLVAEQLQTKCDNVEQNWLFLDHQDSFAVRGHGAVGAVGRVSSAPAYIASAAHLLAFSLKTLPCRLAESTHGALVPTAHVLRAAAACLTRATVRIGITRRAGGMSP